MSRNRATHLVLERSVDHCHGLQQDQAHCEHDESRGAMLQPVLHSQTSELQMRREGSGHDEPLTRHIKYWTQPK